VTCLVVQEGDQPQLYEAVSRAVQTGSPFAVLDPTWSASFLSMATGQVEDALARGALAGGDLVVFSSGSTGRPRGVVRTVESWQASVPSLSEVTGITGQDRVWLTGPLWSSLFLYGAFHARSVGAQVILRDSDESASATALHCVPSQLPGLLQRARAGGLPRLRVAVVAGDHLATPLREQCEMAGWRVVEYYGAAELSFVAWRDGSGPFRSFPGVETELRAGMLWARSPYLARGYLDAGTRDSNDSGDSNDSKDSKDSNDSRNRGDRAGPFQLDSQGWATVGDLARGAAGGLEILGRGDAAVTSGGHTVLVEEVEQLLRGIQGVDDVAVLGLPHPRLGQVLAAVVVGPAGDASLRAAAAVMPDPSRPRRWLHADALPRTSGGKVRREALPDLVAKLQQP
jgi:long-chain acyl-CoA synthetase